jgi:hypothetical protein
MGDFDFEDLLHQDKAVKVVVEKEVGGRLCSEFE